MFFWLFDTVQRVNQLNVSEKPLHKAVLERIAQCVILQITHSVRKQVLILAEFIRAHLPKGREFTRFSVANL